MTRRTVLRARAGRRSSPWLRQGRALVTCVDHRPAGDAGRDGQDSRGGRVHLAREPHSRPQTLRCFPRSLPGNPTQPSFVGRTRQGTTSQQHCRSTLLFVARVVLLVFNLVGVPKQRIRAQAKRRQMAEGPVSSWRIHFCDADQHSAF